MDRSKIKIRIIKCSARFGSDRWYANNIGDYMNAWPSELYPEMLVTADGYILECDAERIKMIEIRIPFKEDIYETIELQ